MMKDANPSYVRDTFYRPYTHEATITVSSTALALSAQKWGTLTEKSGSAQVASWTLKGVNYNNSVKNGDTLELYWKLTDSGGTRTVSVYKAQAMGSSDKVAEGSNAGDGTITLAEQNSSGITGSVAVTYTANDTDKLNIISIAPRAIYAEVTIDTNNVRYWVDNTVPTASDGHLAPAIAATAALVPVATIIKLRSAIEIMNFRVIRESADAKMSVTYYE
jgi:hypothetical protein